MSKVRDAFGSLSVVVPAYNAAGVLARTIGEIEAYLAAEGVPNEIIVVNDGSRDGTVGVIDALGMRVQSISFGVNRGKGAAVRAGMAASGCDWVLFTDADHSTRIEHLERFAARADSADVLIASRRLPESRIVRAQPRFRQRLGRTFPAFVRWLALPDIEDSQCGFKLFRREGARELAARQTIERFCFDVELLVIARARGLRIAEVPIDWDNPRDSTLRIGRDAPRMLWDLLRISYRAMRGGYSA